MRDLLQEFSEHLARRHRATRTIQTYRAITEAFLAFLQSAGRAPAAATRTDVERFLARPRRDGATRAPVAINQSLAAIRALTHFAQEFWGWPNDATAGLAFLPEPPHDPPVLSPEEVRALLVAVNAHTIRRDRARNLALVGTLAVTGLRVHELVGLDVHQVDELSESFIAVKGKGGSVHDQVLNREVLDLLRVWREARGKRALPTEPALFVSAQGTRLSIRSVEALFQRLRVAMGTAKKITPHTMRHTTATTALAQGANLVTVAGLLRHADLNTTRRYIHLVDTERRDAVRKLGPLMLRSVAPVPSSSAATANLEDSHLPGRTEGRGSPIAEKSCGEGDFFAAVA